MITLGFLSWFQEEFYYGLTLIPQNLPSMIIEVAVLGFGISWLVRSFEGRLEKRRFVREAFFETSILFRQAGSAIASLSTSEIEHYRDHRAIIEEQGSRLHKLYDLNVKSLNPVQKRFYESFLENVDTLIGLLRKNIPGNGADSEKAKIITQRIKDEMSIGLEYFSPIALAFNKFALNMWGIIVPFSRPWGRIRSLARTLDGLLIQLTSPQNNGAETSNPPIPFHTSSVEKYEAFLKSQEATAL